MQAGGQPVGILEGETEELWLWSRERGFKGRLILKDGGHKTVFEGRQDGERGLQSRVLGGVRCPWLGRRPFVPSDLGEER